MTQEILDSLIFCLVRFSLGTIVSSPYRSWSLLLSVFYVILGFRLTSVRYQVHSTPEVLWSGLFKGITSRSLLREPVGETRLTLHRMSFLYRPEYLSPSTEYNDLCPYFLLFNLLVTVKDRFSIHIPGYPHWYVTFRETQYKPW